MHLQKEQQEGRGTVSTWKLIPSEHEVQGALLFKSPLLTLTEDKLLALDGWSASCLAWKRTEVY